MKVWFLLSRWGGGGLERVQANLAGALRDLGDDVELVVGSVVSSGTVDVGQVPMLDLGAKSKFYFLSRLIRKLKDESPQVVVTTSNDVACLLLILKLLQIVRAKIVVTQHLSISGPRRKARGYKRLKLEVIRVLMRLLLPYAEEIIAVSRGVRLDMRRELGLNRPIAVIYNPIVTPFFRVQMEVAGDWPWRDQSTPTVIWVGRLAAEKRLDLLINAFCLMRSKIHARLLIVGDGPQKAKVLEMVGAEGIDDCCKVIDFTDNPLPLMRRSRVLVLCSDYEGFGNVLVEAMACGVNVIATDCPCGPSEILGGGYWGRLTSVGDVRELAQAMYSAVTVPMLAADELRKRASNFSVESALQRYRNIIRS